MKRTRTAYKLSDSVSHKLNMYALAASAGALSLAQPAEAKIIYTRTHKNIPPNYTLPLDLNHHAITDFNVTNLYNRGCTCGSLYTKPAQSGNAVAGEYNFALALHREAKIDAKLFVHPAGLMLNVVTTDGFSVYQGLWHNVNNRYLGLKFFIKGKAHYGWARLNVQDHVYYITATLTGYAYETIPGKAIIAGKTKGPDVITVEPASLGRLAQGSAGLADWRR